MEVQWSGEGESNGPCFVLLESTLLKKQKSRNFPEKEMKQKMVGSSFSWILLAFQRKSSQPFRFFEGGKVPHCFLNKFFHHSISWSSESSPSSWISPFFLCQDVFVGIGRGD